MRSEHRAGMSHRRIRCLRSMRSVPSPIANASNCFAGARGEPPTGSFDLLITKTFQGTGEQSCARHGHDKFCQTWNRRRFATFELAGPMLGTAQWN